MLDSIQLGQNSGLAVSKLTLGTMNFGEPGRGHQGDWTLDLDQARPIFWAALDYGLFTFDCADVYGLGARERAVGALLRELAPRDQYVIATKISGAMGPNPNQAGLSRKHIMEGVDASLERWASTTSTTSSSTGPRTPAPDCHRPRSRSPWRRSTMW